MEIVVTERARTATSVHPSTQRVGKKHSITLPTAKPAYLRFELCPAYVRFELCNGVLWRY